MNKLTSFALVLGIFALVGAGCANTEAPESAAEAPMQPPVKSAEMMEEKPAVELPDGALMLSGKAVGDNEAQFRWTLSAEMERPDKFILVRSEDENPEYNGVNFWFRVHGTNDNIIWTDLPEGPHNFRICAVKDDACAVYSNNVFVQVQN